MEQELIRVSELRDYTATKKLLDEMNVVDIAVALEDIGEPVALKVFRMLPKDKAAEVFAYLSHEVQREIVGAITDREINAIIEDMFLDDAVDFIEEMPASVVKKVLAGVPAEKREMINAFLQYPEDCAGSVMTIEYVALKRGCSVSEAFDIIRRTGVDKETIYTCYVIDHERRLMGAVSVRTLLLSKPGDAVEDIMDAQVISAQTLESKESLANDFRKYGLLAMPVVDNERRLVGIVTVDDVLTVQEEAATQDFEIMAAMSPSETPYLKTGVFKMTKNRVFWLMLMMLSATVTQAVIAGFEEGLSVMPALIAFIPMLMGTGGNAGAQSSTLVIRGIALEEISLKDTLQVLWKELRVAVLCGAALVVVNFLRVWLTDKSHNAVLAATISLSLYCTVILAKSVGCLLPIGAKRLKLDPAVMASPVITTIVDAGSLVIFFTLAKLILGI
ncbi:MAG: magnesium transporter [Oscillospiraceae bacterium]|jgi:magnesium transporter|nr:magnesium transporter [Oscillospiraceae bacterium]